MAVNGIAERIATEEYHPQPIRQHPPTNPQPLNQPTPQTPQRVSFLAGVGAAFTAIALILSVRVLLLLSIVGAFILGEVAMTAQSSYSLWVLGIFCGFTVPVLTYLDIQTRRR